MKPDHDQETTSPKGLLRSEDRSGKMKSLYENEAQLAQALNSPSSEGVEESWGEHGESRSKRKYRLILIAAILLLLGTWIAVVIIKNDSLPSAANMKQNENPLVQTNFIDRSTPEEIRQATTKTIRGFMDAKTHEERCRYIVNGDSMSQTLTEFYSRPNAAFLPSGFGRVQSAEPAAFDGETLMIALAVDQTGKRAWTYSLFPLSDGLKIDWLTSVSYCEMNWPCFLREKPKQATQMRVYLKRLPGFQATRFQSNTHDAFEVSAYGYQGTEILYLQKTSKSGKELVRLLPKTAKHPVNLSLKWTHDQKTTLQLEKIIHNLWTPPIEAQ